MRQPAIERHALIARVTMQDYREWMGVRVQHMVARERACCEYRESLVGLSCLGSRGQESRAGQFLRSDLWSGAVPEGPNASMEAPSIVERVQGDLREAPGRQSAGSQDLGPGLCWIEGRGWKHWTRPTCPQFLNADRGVAVFRHLGSERRLVIVDERPLPLLDHAAPIIAFRELRERWPPSIGFQRRIGQ